MGQCWSQMDWNGVIYMKITKFKDVPRFTRDGTYQVDYDFKHLVNALDMLEKNHGLQLNPKFQRGHVWTREQQIAWLEFFLRGGRSGRILYFNKPDWNVSVPEGAYNDFVCVDGLQRITAIRAFMNGEIPAFGSYINEFTDQMSIVRDSIKMNVNDLKSEKEVLQWYVDMNAGGTPHTDAEIERVKKMIAELE